MWILASALAFAAPDSVTLQIGVHREAGGLVNVATDGAAGQCSLGPSSITCPATGPVAFRWGPNPSGTGFQPTAERWSIVGDTTLAPGSTGLAFVLRPGDAALLDSLRAQVSDDDPLIRRAAIEALHEWTWSAGYGPLPSTAPVPVPAGWLLEGASDPDWRVRQAMIHVCRDFRDREREPEIEECLLSLASDPHRKVQRAAIAALGGASREGLIDPLDAWKRATDSVPEAGSRGRAASATLARLSTELEADQVDPVSAIELVIAHHPEQAWRVWGAWRDEVPLRRDWLLQLLTTTSGLHRGLLRKWAAADPAGFASTLAAWEPREPHSERWRVIQLWISDPVDG